MLTSDEIKLATILQKHRLTERESFSEEIVELLAVSVAYVANIRPNFDPMIKNPLSLQEMFSMILLAHGKTAGECADILGVTYNTLHTYERRARIKLGAYNRTHAFYLAITRKYLTIRH